jgi:hypothetical protein
MEAIRSSESSVNFQRTKWRYIPEDSTLRNHRCEKLKFYNLIFRLITETHYTRNGIIYIPCKRLTIQDFRLYRVLSLLTSPIPCKGKVKAHWKFKRTTLYNVSSSPVPRRNTKRLKRPPQNFNLLDILFYSLTILGFEQEGSWLLVVQQQGL